MRIFVRWQNFTFVTSAHRTPQKHDFFNVFSRYKRNHGVRFLIIYQA